jgi:hypothetical protein
MKNNNGYGVLWVEAAGFCFLIALSWINELTDFQVLVFPGYRANWREAAIETVAAIFVGSITLVLTKRLLNRLHYLEGYLRICAWCRRLDSDGVWVPVEQYFTDQFSLESTHGICPECAKKMIEE